MQSNTTKYSPKIIQIVKNISIFLIEKKARITKQNQSNMAKEITRFLL
jgi:hypothetical protein